MTKEINVISVSGGKDSTAMLLLAIERGTENICPVFCDTGNEHPLTYQYIKYLAKSTGLEIRWLKADYNGNGSGIRDAVTWSRTTRGGRQYDMFADGEQAGSMCSSKYGLCE